MQIITIENAAFSSLLQAHRAGKEIGSFSRNGEVLIVKATPRFVLVSASGTPNKIALTPVHNAREAEERARQVLRQEEERGASVTVAQ